MKDKNYRGCIDLENEYNKANQSLKRVQTQTTDKLWELAQKYPEAVIYTYGEDLAEVKAIIFSSREQVSTIWILDKFKYIKAIEKYIESQCPIVFE